MVREDARRVIQGVGRRVAELRAERGWTQEALAERAGVSVQWLRRIETGRANMTLRTMVAVARHLGVRAVDLMSAPGSLRVAKGRPRTRNSDGK